MNTHAERPMNSVSKIGWYATFCLIPFGNSTLGLLVLLIGRLIDIIRGRGTRDEVSSTPLVLWINRLVFILLAVVFLSSAVSSRPLLALVSSFGYSLVFFVFFFGGQHMSFLDLSRRYLKMILIFGFAAPLLALVRYYVMSDPYIDRAVNLFSGPNGMGTTLIMVGGLSVGYLLWRGGRWRYLIYPYLGVIGAALLASKSRGGWIGFGAMLCCFSMFNRKVLPILLMVVILFALVFAASPMLRTRLVSIGSMDSNTTRLTIWHNTFKMIGDYPILGVGTGVFPFVYKGYTTPDYPEREPPYAHNLFLQVAAEFGLIGLAVFLAIIGAVLYMSFSLARKADNPVYQAMFAVLVGVLVHQQVDIPIWGLEIGGAFWMLVGMTIGFYRLESCRVNPAWSCTVTADKKGG